MKKVDKYLEQETLEFANKADIKIPETNQTVLRLHSYLFKKYGLSIETEGVSKGMCRAIVYDVTKKDPNWLDVPIFLFGVSEGKFLDVLEKCFIEYFKIIKNNSFYDKKRNKNIQI